LLEVEQTWQKIAAHVDVVVVRGTHVSIVLEPFVHVVAQDLRKRFTASCTEEATEQPLAVAP
jgi:thioesterase domain-containing protein